MSVFRHNVKRGVESSFMTPVTPMTSAQADRQRGHDDAERRRSLSNSSSPKHSRDMHLATPLDPERGPEQTASASKPTPVCIDGKLRAISPVARKKFDERSGGLTRH